MESEENELEEKMGKSMTVRVDVVSSAMIALFQNFVSVGFKGPIAVELTKTAIGHVMEKNEYWEIKSLYTDEKKKQ